MFCKLATGQKTTKLFKLNTFQPSAPDGVDTGEGEEGGAGKVVVDNKNKLDKDKLDKALHSVEYNSSFSSKIEGRDCKNDRIGKI